MQSTPSRRGHASPHPKGPRPHSRPLTPSSLQALEVFRGTRTLKGLARLLRVSDFTLRRALRGAALGRITLRHLEEFALPRMRRGTP